MDCYHCSTELPERKRGQHLQREERGVIQALKRQELFPSGEMVSTRTLYNEVWAGSLPIGVMELHLLTLPSVKIGARRPLSPIPILRGSGCGTNVTMDCSERLFQRELPCTQLSIFCQRQMRCTHVPERS